MTGQEDAQVWLPAALVARIENQGLYYSRGMRFGLVINTLHITPEELRKAATLLESYSRVTHEEEEE
jgi:hypothetical protein